MTDQQLPQTAGAIPLPTAGATPGTTPPCATGAADPPASVFTGTVNEHGAIVIDPGDETDPHRTHRCTRCGFLFGTEDPAQRDCGQPPCPSAVAVPR